MERQSRTSHEHERTSLAAVTAFINATQTEYVPDTNTAASGFRLVQWASVLLHNNYYATSIKAAEFKSRSVG